jgi:hypothetical protein
MLKGRFVVGLTLLSALAMSSAASGALYFDIWPATVDGSMDQHPSEGYAIGSEGNLRFTKSYHHMTFLGFTGKSDGPDGIPQDKQKGGVNDSDDGILMADWLVGKKAFHAAVYVRDALTSRCDPYAAEGTYLNSPTTIVGFRVANDGSFVDRGTGARGQLTPPNGFTGCCAGYLSPLLEGGENAPPAWRMGAPNVDRAGVKGYSQPGDINETDPQAEWYKASMVDSLYAGQEVKVGSAGFGTTGFGGYCTNPPGLSGSGRFAFDYLIQKSDAMIVNSATMTEADCTGYAGEEEPRDFAGDLNYGEGWYAEVVDRGIIQAMVTPNDTTGIVECKGLVFHSSAVALYQNPSIFGRDQGGGESGAYLAITATIAGDVDNDGCNDVVDLLYLVDSFGTGIGDALFNPESDFNSDGYIDVVDLLTLVETFGLCTE